MKRKNLFVLMFAAVLTIGLSSCGSDNEGAPPAPAPAVTNNNPVTSTTINGVSQCATATTYNDFRNKVHNGEFVQETRDIETYRIAEYQFKENDGWWIFDTYKFERMGSFDRTSYKGEDRVVHEVGTTKTAVLNHLKSIVDNARNHAGMGSYHEILHTDGMIYGINLCSPIAANPVYVRDPQSGDFEMLEYASSSMSNFTYPYNNFYRF